MHAPSDHDRSGFAAQLAAHAGILHKVAFAHARNADERAELVQEMSARLWQAWPAYDPARPFSTWMYRVATNVAISASRRARLRRHDPLDDSHALVAGDLDVDFESRQRIALLQRALDALAAPDRTLLLMHLDGEP